MELVQQYLDSVQKVQGMYVLTIDEQDPAAFDYLVSEVRKAWQEMTNEPLLILPHNMKLEYVSVEASSGLLRLPENLESMHGILDGV